PRGAAHVLPARGVVLDLGKVQARVRHADALEISEPVRHLRELVAAGVTSVKGDDQARRDTLATEPIDGRVSLGGGFPGAREASRPADVVELAGAVDRDADLNPV